MSFSRDEFVIVTNIARLTTARSAAAVYRWIGSKDVISADESAVSEARKFLSQQQLTGIVRIGEGERDNAPMLYCGEVLGIGGLNVDIAIDPLEGTNMCASSLPGSMTVIAIGESDTVFESPDVYMEKIATCVRNKYGHPIPAGVIDIRDDLIVNISRLADAIDKPIANVNVCILDRPRNRLFIEKVLACGANLTLIEDGDVMAVMGTLKSADLLKNVNNSIGQIDLYVGIGGAPEGVLAAAFVKSIHGVFQCRLVYEGTPYANSLSYDKNTIYTEVDLVKGDVVFSATFVTGGVYCVKKVDKVNYEITTIVCSTLNNSYEIIKDYIVLDSSHN